MREASRQERRRVAELSGGKRENPLVRFASDVRRMHAGVRRGQVAATAQERVDVVSVRDIAVRRGQEAAAQARAAEEASRPKVVRRYVEGAEGRRVEWVSQPDGVEEFRAGGESLRVIRDPDGPAFFERGSARAFERIMGRSLADFLSAETG
jgi:hypothetical protein